MDFSPEVSRRGNSNGILFEWVMPFGNKDYIYLTALMVYDKDIVIAEGAGEHTIYTKYRGALLESLKSISF